MPLMPQVSHVEWCVPDPARVADLLQTLFGWDFECFGSRYRQFTPASGGTCFGLLQGDAAAESTVVYVQVASLQASLSRALELGAELHCPPTEVAGHGRYARLRIAGVHLLGLFEAG